MMQLGWGLEATQLIAAAESVEDYLTFLHAGELANFLSSSNFECFHFAEPTNYMKRSCVQEILLRKLCLLSYAT